MTSSVGTTLSFLSMAVDSWMLLGAIIPFLSSIIGVMVWSNSSAFSTEGKSMVGALYRSSSCFLLPGTTLKGEVLPCEPRADFRGLLFFFAERMLGER